MNNWKHRLAVPPTIVAIIAIAAATLGAQAKADITGKWTFEVQTDAGSGTPTVTFKQDGEKLTGHYSSATLGEADLTGTVKGSNVNFTFDVDLGGQAGRVTYTATIESNNTMKGTIDIAGVAGGTFTGKRS
jgi:plastocyanin